MTMLRILVMKGIMGRGGYGRGGEAYAEKNATVTARTRVKFHDFRPLLQFWGWLDEMLRGEGN